MSAQEALRQLPAKFQQALALHQRGQLALARTLYQEIVALQPRHFDALNLLGVMAIQIKDPRAALEWFDKAIEADPGNATAFYNRGLALQQLRQLDTALASYDRAVSIKPDYSDAHFNRGNLLRELQQFEAALASYERAIVSKPDHAEAYLNRGNVQRQLRRAAAALSSYDRAIAMRPEYGEAHANRGHALHDLKEYEAAIASYDRALELKPHIEFLSGQRLHTKMQICDWRNFELELGSLGAGIARNEAVCNPFFFLALSESPALQRKAAEIWVREQCPANSELPAMARRPRRDKIRLGYFSADYRNHAVAILTAELFELHDRSKFEVIAFSLGPDTQDQLRVRLAGAFDRFIDVRDMSDRDIALLAREIELDIAIDLGGFTVGSRTTIFAMRAAPLQVSYLGYLGTTGADYMDYLIADECLVPAAHRGHYAEKLIYLRSYQVNDSRRQLPGERFTRDELGLPPSAFVFCCFNDNYKITPSTFDGWMRILGAVPGSVLFLYAASEAARRNLKQEALTRGVDAERLVFGAKLPYCDYLARYCSADLFLDTLPYNAGTTASDALWMGLPVITCCGDAFASRVAGSLMHAVGLAELITTTRSEYEQLAVALATDPQRLAKMREHLAGNRSRAPLFDTRRFAEDLEAAFVEIHERHCSGLPPEHIGSNLDAQSGRTSIR